MLKSNWRNLKIINYVKHNKISTEINNWIADKELINDYLIEGIDIIKNENC